MYTRLLLESLRRGTRRKLLAVTAVALGTLGATALGEVMLASGDRLAAELASYGANLELVPGPGRETLAVNRLAAVRRIFWRNNIVAVAPLYPLRLRLSAAPASAATAKSPVEAARPAAAQAGGAVPGAGPAVIADVIGTWFHVPLERGFTTGLPFTRPTLRVAGRWPHDGLAAAGGAEAAVGRRLAARLHLGIGGHLRAALGERSAPLAVTGIVTSGGEEDEQAFVPLAVVGRLAGLPGRFVRAEIFAQTNPESGNVRDPRRMTPQEYEKWYCTAYPSSVAFQLRQALPEADARVVSRVTAATADVLGKLRGVLLALAAVALAGAAVGVTAAMTATVLERRLEAGLMVAIGAARRRVVAFFLLEAALLGGLGGLLGGVLGLAAGRLLGAGALGVEVAWKPVLLPFAVLLGLVVAVLASALPVSRALGRYPAALLKRATA
ncbi:MAG: FtsX-like permease family protein [Acidobacteria bacterium]|nr:FtsX-like permease family protein [Acidobacteriota bacterium]